MSPLRTIYSILLLSTLAADACGPKIDPINDSGSIDPNLQVTYCQHIEVLLQVCVGCHHSALSGTDRNGAPVGVEYDGYENAVRNALLGNGEIQRGEMPPAGSGFQLSSLERETFAAWLDQGTLNCGGCGDSWLGPGEDCDGTELAAQSCPSRGFVGGVLACTATCTWDETACYD